VSTPHDPPAPTFTLIAKPTVTMIPGRLRWQVAVTHAEGLYTEAWVTHASAMNCALAIAKTSNWRPPVQDGAVDWSPKCL